MEQSTIECSRWRAREAVGGTAASAGRGGAERGGAGRGRAGRGRARPDRSSPEKAPAARVPVSAGNSTPCPTLVLQTSLCGLCNRSELGPPGKDPCPLPRVFASLGPSPPPKPCSRAGTRSRLRPTQETSKVSPTPPDPPAPRAQGSSAARSPSQTTTVSLATLPIPALTPLS